MQKKTHADFWFGDLSKSFKAKYYCVYYGFSVIITHYIIEMLGRIVNNCCYNALKL